jgi:hypothetical protein
MEFQLPDTGIGRLRGICEKEELVNLMKPEEVPAPLSAESVPSMCGCQHSSRNHRRRILSESAEDSADCVALTVDGDDRPYPRRCAYKLGF